MPGYGLGLTEGLFCAGEAEAPGLLEAVLRQTGAPLLRDRIGDRLLEARLAPDGTVATRWLSAEEAAPLLATHRFWRDSATWDDCFAMVDEETELAVPGPDPAHLGGSSWIAKGLLEFPGRRLVFVDAAHLKQALQSRMAEEEDGPPVLARAVAYLETCLAHGLPFHVYMRG